MKRKLNKDELELTRKNTNKNKKLLAIYLEDLRYTRDFIQFKKKHKKYNQKRREQEEENTLITLEKTMEMLESKMSMLEENIKVSEDQIKNGVEIKIKKAPPGVN